MKNVQCVQEVIGVSRHTHYVDTDRMFSDSMWLVHGRCSQCVVYTDRKLLVTPSLFK